MSQDEERGATESNGAKPAPDSDGDAPEQAPTSASGEQSGGGGDRGAPAGRPSRGPAWFAVLLALAALALAARPFWPPSVPGAPQRDGAAATAQVDALENLDALENRLASLRERLDRAEQSLRESLESVEQDLSEDLSMLEDRLEQRAAGAERRAEDAGRRAQGADQRFGAMQDSIDSLRARLDRLESRRNEAEGRVTGRLDELEQRLAERLERFDARLSRVGDERELAREAHAARLRLSEIDQLVSIGRHRLGLGDIEAARRAWQWALDQIESLDGSRYTALREAARADFERLRDYQPPARHEQVEALLSLAEGATAWPTQVMRTSAGDDGSPDQPQAGWRGRVGDVVSRLVRVESLDPKQPAIVDVARVRAELRARLVTAALALARGDDELVRMLLDDAVSDIEGAFATDDEDVAAALRTLRGMDTTPQRPPTLTATREQLNALLGNDE